MSCGHLNYYYTRQVSRVKLIDQGWRKEAWPDCLPEALLTINLAPDSETKKSAYVRVYGQNPITKATVWFGQVPNNQIDEINQEIEHSSVFSVLPRGINFWN